MSRRFWPAVMLILAGLGLLGCADNPTEHLGEMVFFGLVAGAAIAMVTERRTR